MAMPSNCGMLAQEKGAEKETGSVNMVAQFFLSLFKTCTVSKKLHAAAVALTPYSLSLSLSPTLALFLSV
jgi:hypothetical protein